VKISELGEFRLIDLLTRTLNEAGRGSLHRPGLILGIGDDAAAFACGETVRLITSDMMVEGVHFRTGFGSWFELGWKALAVNLSDLAAMGGTPEYAVIALGLPADTEVDDVEELYRGIAAIAMDFDVTIAGGDTVKSPVVTICPAVVGTASKSHIMTRSGARSGDAVAVTGYTGMSAAGLLTLQHDTQQDDEPRQQLRQAHLHPVPRLREGQLLAESGVRAAIDISDGLLADLSHICQSSGLAATVNIPDLPVPPALLRTFPDKAIAMALSGGEDYELLFTAEPEIIKTVSDKLKVPVTIIGKMTSGQPGEVTVIDENGSQVQPAIRGWQHFPAEPPA